MWPWEHAAVGYLVYSILCRVVGKRPTDGPALAVLFGTQFPDLVDKPLGWVVGILPAGQSLGHSLLVAVPLSLLLVAVGVWQDRRRGGRTLTAATTAFSVGYLAHLPGDVIYPALLGGELNTRILFWPLVPAIQTQPADAIGYVGELFQSFLTFLSTPTGGLYLVGELVMLLVAVLVWRADGYPGLVWSTQSAE